MFIAVVFCAEVPTNCNQQLHNYYVALGMPMVTPVLGAINLTQAGVFPATYVVAEIDIQGVARYYASLLPNTTLANQTWDVDITIDIPWCVSELLFECCDNISTGTAKSSNCTTISDFDAGGSNPVAGRFYIYINQTYPCNGRPRITFYNTTINMGGTGTWTYEAIGIRDHIQMSYQQARVNYRNSKCLFTDGNPADMVDQNIFVCTMPEIACNGTREGGLPSLEVIPLPMYQCIGQTEPNGTTKVIVGVYNIQPPAGIQGYFGIAFTEFLETAAWYEEELGNIKNQRITIANTRRQFAADFDNLDFYTLLRYQGRTNNYKQVYPFSRDPKLMAVPCVCDFSMDCLEPGTADITSDATFQLSLNNAVPVCSAGAPLVISLGTPNITLNATQSFDPDGGPGIFSVQWGIYSTPYGPGLQPFNITVPSAMEYTIDSSNLTSGVYIFILWTSDQQAITVCTWNVTILSNQVFAVITPGYNYGVTFDFYSGAETGHECSIYPPSPYITLNGTLTYATVPSTNISYYWQQTNGPPLLYSCDDIGFFTTRAFFNTTQAIAHFVPSTVGQYCFQLIAGDGIYNSTPAQICIKVQPNFGQPNFTMTPIDNYTYPPLRNLTENGTQNVTFPPSTPAPFEPFAPVAPPPTGQIVVPPLIIIQPNASNTEILGLFLGSMGWLIIGVFLYVVWISYGNVNYTGHLQRRIFGGDNS